MISNDFAENDFTSALSHRKYNSETSFILRGLLVNVFLTLAEKELNEVTLESLTASDHHLVMNKVAHKTNSKRRKLTTPTEHDGYQQTVYK